MDSPGFNIRLKFILGLVLFTLLLGFILSITMYFHFDSIMKSEISQRSRMLLAQSTAIQEYVKTELRPEMFKIIPDDRFVPKAMSSSYISREIMSRLNLNDKFSYHYRRVARNARNPESAPDELETRLIHYFNTNRSVSIWEDDSMVNNEDYHLIARPIEFGASCMNCHGVPENAPTELIKIYGDKGGFHYETGEVGGVVVAGFPVAMIKNPVKEVTLQYLSLYLLGILFFVVLISLFFDRLVMKNLQTLTQIFKTRFSGSREQGIIKKMEKKDEIEGMIEGVDELALCLSDARNKLEDYTLNLEKMVKERTQDLIDKAEKHHGDVALFVGLLSHFSDSVDISHLIQGVLKTVGKRFDASDVIYHPHSLKEISYSLSSDAGHGTGQIDLSNLEWKNELLLDENHLYIPVASIEHNFGVLCISWPESPDYNDLDAEVLVAIGRQLGVLIENIQAISSIKFQNDMLQSVFDGISDPLLLIDRNCCILKANKGSKRIFPGDDIDTQEALLRTFPGIGSDPGLIQTVINSGELANAEVKTEDDRHFVTHIYPLPFHEGSSSRMVLYAREVTMEKKMVLSMQQAERLSSIGKMAAGMAHEINNPLGVISCYADLVRDAVSDADVVSDLDVILKQTTNVQKIVQDLLNLARPKQALSGICSANTVVRSLIEVFKAQAASKNINVISDLDSELPDIRCDAGILEQILTNIWLNAFDALSKVGGEVRISTRAGNSKNEVVLSVEDNGPGIPSQMESQIFDPFFTTKDAGKGTGLGLSVVYGFINELGGRIELSQGEMTGFLLFFPVA